MAHNFLFELGTEELPSKAVLQLSQALAELLGNALTEAGITYTKMQSFASPRRLAVLLSGLPSRQQDVLISRRGPAKAQAYDAEGKPSKALLGFAQSLGVSLDALGMLRTDKGDWVHYEANRPGEEVRTLLPALIEKALAKLPIAKAMRWANHDFSFARPVHWVVMLWDTEIVPAQLFGINAGRATYGHRYHHPEAIFLAAADEYETVLEQAMVIADFSKRRRQIRAQIDAAATSLAAIPIVPDALLDEVCSIVEYPVAYAVDFDRTFLEVPAEALIASMQAHQKCFALTDKNGVLLPHFITIANIQSSKPASVVSGNAKVMRARLSDAAFFFHQDKAIPLASYVPKLDKVVFQEKLGSIGDKIRRQQRMLEAWISRFNLNAEEAKRALLLSKCDLLSGMVGEFPELQGTMGQYYATLQGENIAVAKAIYEQYLPRFSGDILPESSLGMALSLADRLDTLFGIFAIGERPSGVKDPFKLRRHALAVLRILTGLSGGVRLQELLADVAKAYQDLGLAAETSLAVQAFVLERMHGFYQAEGLDPTLLPALLARQNDDFYDLRMRMDAFAKFAYTHQDWASYHNNTKRIANFKAHWEPLAEGGYCLSRTMLTEPAELALFDAFNGVLIGQDYDAALQACAEQLPCIEQFFADTMVMAEDSTVRNARLLLLAMVYQRLTAVAELEVLHGERQH